MLAYCGANFRASPLGEIERVKRLSLLDLLQANLGNQRGNVPQWGENLHVVVTILLGEKVVPLTELSPINVFW